MYTVSTETRGVLTFTELPPKTYFAMGCNGLQVGQAMLLTWDNGTCLIPIMQDGKQISFPEKAGLTMEEFNHISATNKKHSHDNNHSTRRKI
jgi:hypothetical protein